VLDDAALGEVDALVQQKDRHLLALLLGHHGEEQGAGGAVGVVGAAGKGDQDTVVHGVLLLLFGVFKTNRFFGLLSEQKTNAGARTKDGAWIYPCLIAGGCPRNEIGEVGLDGKLLDYTVTEIDEGCVCCSLVGNLKRAVQGILENFSPDTVILETSGVSNPKNLLDELGELMEMVRVDCTATIVDALNFETSIEV
jgi:hypothetical protein